MAELRFYLDAHIDKQVAAQLRNHQVAVVRCQEVGLADIDDESHLTYASENHLMLVTKDADFRDLHFQWLQTAKTMLESSSSNNASHLQLVRLSRNVWHMPC